MYSKKSQSNAGKMLGASCAGMLRQTFGRNSGAQRTGVSRSSVRAADADDQIAEALEARAARRRRPR
jgi:hypothetical protein